MSSDGDEDAVGSIGWIASMDVKKVQEHESYTYHRKLAEKSLTEAGEDGVILGVDEAGRGPVLGPMVYAAAYCRRSYLSGLKGHGFADSKTLDAATRGTLFQHMHNPQHTLGEEIGWAVRIMSAKDISAGMLHPTSVYNLNAQAHDATIALIQSVIDAGVHVTEIFVDTVGIPAAYQAKLARYFPHAQVTVSKKADSIYPIVSVASICAKVTRDGILQALGEMYNSAEHDWGSGYPSDPRTIAWLKAGPDPIFGWSAIVRFSWQTARDLLDKVGARVIWPVPEDAEQSTITSILQPKHLTVSTALFGRHVGVDQL